jgi:hypothetical protein
MIIYRIAYRHANGEVEGFTGSALSGEQAARHNAVRQIQSKCNAIGTVYLAGRTITSFTGLTPEEIKTIQADWKIGG